MTPVVLPQNRWDLLDGCRAEVAPGVTVVIPHFRQQAELDRTLAALAAQTHPGPLEIIVVDDGSPEPPTVPEHVRLIVQEDRGFRLAAARNAGAAASTQPILCFLDADTAPEPDYVSELTRLPALCADAVTVGRRRHADFTDVPVSTPLPAAALGRELDEPRWLSDGYRDTRDLLDADDRGYRYVIGAVVACTADFFAAVGGFDETFTRYGGEDWEWAYRAWLAGAVLAHVPTAIAWHDGPEPGRRDIDLVAKNAETLLLSRLIPVPGSAGRGIRGPFPDVVVRVPMGGGDAQRYLAMDSVLAELPAAAVDGPTDRARFEISIDSPVRVRPGALAPLLESVSRRAVGSMRIESTDGCVLLTIHSLRARARSTRRGSTTCFPTEHVTAAGIEPITEEPDLEAHLGGWDR